MKFKANFPFIYFSMEPSIVLVYEIEVQNYLSVSNLSESDKWETFELNPGEDFETFHHKESKPREGRSYWFRQEDMNKMVEVINHHIQQYRHSQTASQHQGATSAVHIVSSESAAGSVRAALAPPKQVIGFPDTFSIGPLWKLDEKIGQASRNEWLVENINDEQDDYEYQNKFANTLREIEDISGEVPIYIWYGDNVDEQVGLRFFLYVLRNKENDIFLVNTTELSTSKNEEQPIFHTSQMESKDLRLVFNNGSKPLTDQERLIFQKEWETLSKTEEVLRLWVNEEIIGVPENHYDTHIIRTVEKLHNEQITKDFIKTGTVLGELVTQMDEIINIWFLEYRVRHLVYSGVLELKGIPKSMRHYSIKLFE
ncbi:hypothetical protein AEA09_10805 [Lysinibacillus contaminans]|uniref:DUF1835 domain-containing protein n=1 Tax=Lysinibacillus contaminans TaxID=1293441 RepID=A0ABR5K3Q2_9BACI|nr:DUF1835 domain-containing protein [Lysinibacillus contaminans]KOS68984.1 hypothetical protein AEA09_10805 [Lysinibacillus contaminans]